MLLKFITKYMTKQFFTVIAIFAGIIISNAQSFWTKAEETKIQLRSDENRTVKPDKYLTYHLDIEGLKTYLANAPMESDADRKQKELILQVPMPDGKSETFRVYQSPVMDAGISSRYPSIKSYKAYSTENKPRSMRFSVSVNGFYAAISSLDGEKYIDPYSTENIHDYIVYNVSDDRTDPYKGVSRCGVDEVVNRSNNNFFRPDTRGAAEVQLRVYRLAVACTGEWGARRGTVEKCLADINTMVNRMNQIYEREMAVRFVLIDQNDKLIFLNGVGDPYDNSDEGKKLVGVNTTKLNAIISPNDYDIGHVLSVCFDIGGVAQLGSLCQSNKGNGVTCNNDNNLASAVTRVMAHEVGHQFNASHSWNICTSSSDQRAPDTAYEPGSGTTIMSYAGSCGTDNVASDNDDYFHVGSLVQMYSKTLQGGNAYSCAGKIGSGNHFPVVTMPSKSYVIPISTPFELGAAAKDEDGDILTYCWEQYDVGPEVTLGTASTAGPLFRSFKPAASGDVRFFPRAANLVSGNFTDKTEVLPTVTRDLNFKFTVRDNHAGTGGVIWNDYKISSTAQAGPFKITFPEIDSKFQVGDQVTVKWNVANTDKAPVNCKLVNIYASFNAALRNDDANLVPLALNVPNDGSQEIYIPNRISNFLRIVIKAADNIFLTCSRLPSKIEPRTTPGIYFETAQNYLKICQPDNAFIEFSTAGLAGFNDQIYFELVSGLPAGAIASFANPSVTAGQKNTLLLNTENLKGSQTGQLLVRAYAPGVDTLERLITYEIVGGDLSGFELKEPANGSEGVQALPNFSWNSKSDAISYEIQVSKNPDFQNIVFTKEVSDITVTSSSILDKATIYYWRVRAKSNCRSGEWSSVFAFNTEVLACKTYESGVQTINISASGTPTVEISVQVPNDGLASDVNIKLIKGEHSRLSDLVTYLVAPSGKESQLWSRKCGTQQNLNLGLDDQSPNYFECPINTGKVYRPDLPLSVFNNEQIKGTWKLRVEDKASGSGGRMQEFKIELCANIVLDKPYLVRNDTLKIYPGNKSFITNSLLLVADNNNTAEELTYTLVEAPKDGNLLYNGNTITAGARFTQADLNASKIIYQGTSVLNGEDYFSFTVSDGQGGWISITRFIIERSEDFVNSINEILTAKDVFINPNPTDGDIQVIITGAASEFTKFIISDLSGRNLMSGTLNNSKNIINTQSLSSGIYLIQLSDGKHSISKKMIKI